MLEKHLLSMQLNKVIEVVAISQGVTMDQLF